MGSRKKATVGYRYLVGMLQGICRGSADELFGIAIGDKRAWTGSVTTNGQITIDAGELFGGDDGEGGVSGKLDVMFGAADQVVPAHILATMGATLPGLRGVTTTHFDGLLCSPAPYPKPWSMGWRRTHNGWDGDTWYPEKARVPMNFGVTAAMNPAHMLYQCWTDRDWGRGVARARLDDAVWRAAADQLASEGFGMCLQWKRQTPISQFMQIIVDHIGAAMYPDPTTGLIVLRLVRGGYDPESAPLFDADSGLLEIAEDEGGSQAAAVNEVVVRYRNALDRGKWRAVRVKSPAPILAMGGVTSVTRDYPGVPTPELALRLAQRDLEASSGFIKRWKVRLDRRAYEVMPGSVFRVRALDRKIVQLVLRAGRVEQGDLQDGSIVVDALQDVFGLPSASYVTPQPGAHVPPVSTAVPMAGAVLLEVPYRDLAARLEPYQFDQLTPEAAFVAAAGPSPGPATLGFELRTRVGSSGAFQSQDEGSTAPHGVLAAGVGAAATVLPLASANSLSTVELGTAALLGDEIVRVDAIDLGTLQVTVGRGCADTVPRPHAAGATLLFYEDSVVGSDFEFTAGVTVQAKLLTRTTTQQLAEADAPVLSVALAQRQHRPYPPGAMRINGAAYPAVLAASPLVLSWAARNRLTQADLLVDTLSGAVTAEVGTTYSVEVRDHATSTLLAAAVGLTGASWTWAPTGAGQLRVRLWSVRAGLASTFVHEHVVEYSARLATEAGEPLCAESGAVLNLG